MLKLTSYHSKKLFRLLRAWLCLSSTLCVFILLDASIINPDFANDQPGFATFCRGRNHFEKGELKEATAWFAQACKESLKPSFCCGNFVDRGDYVDFDPCTDCEFTKSECKGKLRDYYAFTDDNILKETSYTIFRYSHFYLGLINLDQQKIYQANVHFKKAIGFGGDENKIGTLYFRTMNLINPSWIVHASLTSLALGDVEAAEQFVELAFKTNDFLDMVLGQNDAYWQELGEFGEVGVGELMESYREDLKRRNIDQEWGLLQQLDIYNVKSMVAKARGDIKKAIEVLSEAIQQKDLMVKLRMIEESSDNFVLYSNLGILYLEANNYRDALIYFNKAIELNPIHADNYSNRAQLYLAMGEDKKAADDYEKAIQLSSESSEK
jgi:tetratricopeptide (TPR) repeat protein